MPSIPALAWPAALDPVTAFGEVKNNAVTALTADVEDSDTTLSVASTAAFPSTGYLTIGDANDPVEIVSYSGKTSNQFTGVTRGEDGTAAQDWSEGVKVSRRIVAADKDLLIAAIRQVQRYQGINPQGVYASIRARLDALEARIDGADILVAAFGVISDADQGGSDPAASLGDVYVVNNWGAGTYAGTYTGQAWTDGDVAVYDGSDWLRIVENDGGFVPESKRVIIIDSGAAGGFAGRENEVATADGDGGWEIVTPTDGVHAFVTGGEALDEGVEYAWDDTPGEWVVMPTGAYVDPMTTRGDMIYRDATNTTARLAIGTLGQFIGTEDGVDTSWRDVANVTNANPTVNDDDTAGFFPGEVWVNESGPQVFQCVSNATGAAYWRPLFAPATISSALGDPVTYATIAAAFAAAVAGDTIEIAPGNWAESVTLPNVACRVVGYGARIVGANPATGVRLTGPAAANVTVEGVEVVCPLTAVNAIHINGTGTVTFRGVKTTQPTGGVGYGLAVTQGTADIQNCDLAGVHALRLLGNSAIVNVAGGTFAGSTYDIRVETAVTTAALRVAGAVLTESKVSYQEAAFIAGATYSVKYRDPASSPTLLPKSSPGGRVLASSPYTVSALQDDLILVNAAGGTRVVNLPAVAGVPDNFRVTVKVIDASNNTTVVPSGAETIDGVNAAVRLTRQYEWVTLGKVNGAWSVVGRGQFDPAKVPGIIAAVAVDPHTVGNTVLYSYGGSNLVMITEIILLIPGTIFTSNGEAVVNVGSTDSAPAYDDVLSGIALGTMSPTRTISLKSATGAQAAFLHPTNTQLQLRVDVADSGSGLSITAYVMGIEL